LTMLDWKWSPQQIAGDGSVLIGCCV
jgi:hypothetical protein